MIFFFFFNRFFFGLDFDIILWSFLIRRIHWHSSHFAFINWDFSGLHSTNSNLLSLLASPICFCETRSNADPEETKPSGGCEDLVGEIVGISSCASLFLFASPPELNECFPVPAPNGRAGKTFSTYVRAQLFCASGARNKTQHSVETGANFI